MRDVPEAVRAQIFVARDHYRECFGRNPSGIWLPECAYFQGIERVLAEAEISYFIVDTHGLLFAEPRPYYGVFSPIFTRSGPAAFARDVECPTTSPVELFTIAYFFPCFFMLHGILHLQKRVEGQ